MKILYRVFLVLGASWLQLASPFGTASAQSGNPWLANTGTLIHQETISPWKLPPTLNNTGNIPCTQTDFVIRPRIPGVQSENRQSACAVHSAQGKIAVIGQAHLFGVDGLILGQDNKPARIFAIPGGNGAVVFEEVSYQLFRARYYSNLTQSLQPSLHPQTNSWTFQLINSGDWVLQDKIGNPLAVDYVSTSFSRNGQWMVVSAPEKAVLLVNLQTGGVLPVSEAFKFNSGLVWPQTAVSEDGRTVVASSHAGELVITDVASCQPEPEVITAPVACDRARLDEFLKQQHTTFRRAQHIRFLEDGLMEFYVSHQLPTNTALYRATFMPREVVSSPRTYLALGDSFSSGEGAYDYFPETDTKENMCHLSRQSYPYLIGHHLNLTAFNSVACSGARLQDITTYAQKQHLPASNTMEQLLPGYRKQLAYIKEHNPDVITVGIGGNDIGFIGKMKACLNIGTCYPTYEDRLEIVNEVNRQFDTLVSTYSQIKTEAGSETRLYVVGYPRVALEAGDCAGNVRLDKHELRLVNQLIDYLNQIIQASAARAGMNYADMTETFAGHRFCETDSSKVAINGVTAGNDIFGVIGNESFHPNKLGHELYRDAIIATSLNFMQTTPTANPSIARPAVVDELEILSAPKTNRQVRQIVHDDSLVSELVMVGEPVLLQISAQHFLRPHSSYRVELHSDPINLGSFKTDAAGGAEPSIIVPTAINPGWHTLHIIGVTVEGTAVDIYKTVYIAVSSNDYDGDSIVNTLDECTDQADSRVDGDRDGIDDVCDTDIVEGATTNTRHEEGQVLSASPETLGAVRLVDKRARQQLWRGHEIRLFAVVFVSFILLYVLRRNRKK